MARSELWVLARAVRDSPVLEELRFAKARGPRAGPRAGPQGHGCAYGVVGSRWSRLW